MDLTRSWKGGTVIDILRSEAMVTNENHGKKVFK